MFFIEPSVLIHIAHKDGCDGISVNQYSDIVNALNELKLWKWIKYTEPLNGFVNTNNKYFQSIVNKIDTSNHTGFTIGFMFRKVQSICNEQFKENNICGICLEEDKENFLMFDCGHMFHYLCIKNKKLNRCPLCRQNSIPGYLY